MRARRYLSCPRARGAGGGEGEGEEGGFCREYAVPAETRRRVSFRRRWGFARLPNANFDGGTEI